MITLQQVALHVHTRVFMHVQWCVNVCEFVNLDGNTIFIEN